MKKKIVPSLIGIFILFFQLVFVSASETISIFGKEIVLDKTPTILLTLILSLTTALNYCSTNLIFSFISLLLFSIILARFFEVKPRKIMLISSSFFVLTLFFIEILFLFGLINLSLFINNLSLFSVISKAIFIFIIFISIIGLFFLIKEKKPIKINSKALIILPIISIFLAFFFGLSELLGMSGIPMILSNIVAVSAFPIFYFIVYSLIVCLPFIIIFLIFYFFSKEYFLNLLNKTTQKIGLIILYIILIILSINLTGVLG